jgi:hypothetical protein
MPELTLTPEQADLLGGALGFFFTVALLSYLVGDNPLYRVALHLFVGVSIGYGALVVLFQVLRPRLFVPLTSGDAIPALLAGVPLVLFIFLVLKISPRTAALGNVSIAYMVGVGAAVAVGGGVTGTLIPQVQATWLSIFPGANFTFINNAIIAAGTIFTLLYFQFWLRKRTTTGAAGRGVILRWAGEIGQGFMVLTLGAIYGGMILSGIAVFSERLIVVRLWLTSLMQ